MARWTGTWLSGSAAAGADRRTEGSWPGRKYGLPEDGAGSTATTGARFAALFVDILVGWLIGGLINGYLGDPTFLQRALIPNAAFAAQVILLQALTGQSLGMRLIGIRVARLADPAAAAPGLAAAAARTALLLLILPAVLMDRDGRGLHDKAAGTIVVRAAGSKSFAG